MTFTVQGVLVDLTDDKRIIIEDLIRRFESATRYSYVRICEEQRILDIEKDVALKFSLNGRWSKDAVSAAVAAYAGAVEKVKDGVLESPNKLIWGGRRNFNLRSQNMISNEDWRNIRSSQFMSRGEKGIGNLNLRISKLEKNYSLRINVGDRKWVECSLWVPKKFRDEINNLISNKLCYTVRVRRGKDSRYRVYVTYDTVVSPKVSTFDSGAVGIDINPSSVAWVETNSSGQLQSKGWVNSNELQYVSHNKRNWIVRQVAIQIATLVLTKGKGLVLESLKFKRDKDHGHKCNRIFNQFTYRRLIEAILRECEQRGIDVRSVNPAFTSIIGRMKYLPIYRHLVVHEAAAYVIARRGLGFIDMPVGSQRDSAEEALEARLSEGKLHYWSYWRALKKSGSNRANKKSSRTIGESKQGVSPTYSVGEIPTRYRGKGVSNEKLA